MSPTLLRLTSQHSLEGSLWNFRLKAFTGKLVRSWVQSRQRPPPTEVGTGHRGLADERVLVRDSQLTALSH